MKKLIFTFAIAAITAFAFGQTTPAQKVVKTETKVDSAKARLEAAQKEQQAASDAFIKDAKRQIDANDKEIARLRSTMVKPRSSPQNDAIKKKIDQLEDRNDDLRSKLP
ncbi:MAG: hypothetical protein JWO03_2512 [Bacteroidetes bacterium]|nr:hypothetical protein [Bacteroidota bacterium]